MPMAELKSGQTSGGLALAYAQSAWLLGILTSIIDVLLVREE
jgi:hypothetical protein